MKPEEFRWHPEPEVRPEPAKVPQQRAGTTPGVQLANAWLDQTSWVDDL